MSVLPRFDNVSQVSYDLPGDRACIESSAGTPASSQSLSPKARIFRGVALQVCLEFDIPLSRDRTRMVREAIERRHANRDAVSHGAHHVQEAWEHRSATGRAGAANRTHKPSAHQKPKIVPSVTALDALAKAIA